ncbi:L,D-transpeptidase [Rhodopseudomonas boonkerdii]|uniref:L,D-transpeptidase n=1 Tax=Rhodopseudomonas boonkerdii TaxID=475937 RepID=UPI001E59DB3E|nr:L,D-transpeptidase [Rhodopseudomonas boonkerdii]UGV25354.1 L,D-transpeptidase [Rhodopseudomonas boonkerdii]
MFRKLTCALLASASFVVVNAVPAAAIDAVTPYAQPEVIYAAPVQRPAPQRVASQRGNLGGGFIEFLFSDGAHGSDYGPSYRSAPDAQYSYEPRRRMLPPMEPDQRVMYQREESIDPARPAMDPKYLPQTVAYDGREGAGTIVVDTANKFLYLVQDGGKAMRYGIGVGRPGFTWQGVKTITAKKEWPSWTPPKEMLARRPDLPRYMEGGPENPLGARAMYLGSSLYRIHGSNEPWTIGTNVSSGCFRMRNEDVIDLYGRVNVGAKVVVI